MNTNILFLEGPIQTGKSTLIRSVLGDHLKHCGGFTSQRLIDAAGNTRGFRLGPAARTPLTAPAEAFISPSADDSRSASDDARPFTPNAGIFKWFEPYGRVITDQSVFDTVGVDLLIDSLNAPLILLDEIGGSELLCTPFCDALDAVLESGVPCLGVMKLADGARRLQSQYLPGKGRPAFAQTPPTEKALSLFERNQKIRRQIKDLGGRILYFERSCSDTESIRNELCELIRQAFR